MNSLEKNWLISLFNFIYDDTAKVLKTAAMTVAAPRYIGLMLFISGFHFNGSFLSFMHVLEGFAGLSLAILEGFAISYILSRRQLDFSKVDKGIIIIIVAVLLILLPLCATPYLIYLFDQTDVFLSENNVVKFLWIAATASMPILIIAGVAMVEKDPVDVAIMNAERTAKKKQRLAEISAETEGIMLEYNLKKTELRRQYQKPKQTKASKRDEKSWKDKLKDGEYDY